MVRPKTEDRKLREVRAVLQRLQQIPGEPAPSSSRPVAERAAHPTRHTAIIVALIVATLTFILTISYRFILTKPATPSNSVLAPAISATPRGELASPAPVLQVAVGLMNAGRVQAAREQLLRVVAEGSADVAWALARSYDPTFLSTIPSADAGPDIGEATRWYRAWYTISVKQGLVADSVSVERIINSMR